MKKTWYREGVVYQIYPRSFNDSNGDGIGDIPGIIEKIPYLKTLDIDIIWLSPVYASPLDDNGYDISDYRAIHPDFGTMEDMDRLIEKLHDAGIRLIMDLVVNHTSDEHAWFQKAIGGDETYQDYYYFRDKKRNWTSLFGGDAWTYQEDVGKYYLHLFSEKQPDLNWDNEKVREEVKDIMRFWLDKGVDGFRCDVINLIGKEDGPPNGRFWHFPRGREHYINHPKAHRYLRELRDDVISEYDCFTVGEAVLTSPEEALEYVDEDIRELDMVFQFDHMGADNHFIKWFMKPFKPINLKKPLSTWQRKLNDRGWNSLYLENHDQPRSISRFGSEVMRRQSGTMLATMLYFQRGTPFIYQGQEIGMLNASFEELDDYQDIETHNIYAFGRKWFLSHKRMMKKIKAMSRDNARTPMQWDDSEHVGFTEGTPWIKIPEDHRDINVQSQENDRKSILTYYRRIIALRKKHPVIVYGDYRDLRFENEWLYAYERRLNDVLLTVICNFSDKPLATDLLMKHRNQTLLLSNYANQGDHEALRPYEARVYINEPA